MRALRQLHGDMRGVVYRAALTAFLYVFAFEIDDGVELVRAIPLRTVKRSIFFERARTDKGIQLVFGHVHFGYIRV